MSTPPVDPTRARRATLMLGLVALIWGTTFTLTPMICDGIDRLRIERLDAAGQEYLRPATAAELAAMPSAPMRFDPAADWTSVYYCVLRFGAVVLLMLFWPRVWRQLNRRTWIYGFWLGLLMTAGFLTQTAGLQRTTPAISGFLTALYVPITPLMVWLVWRRAPGARLGLAIMLAFGGVAVLALGGGTTAKAAEGSVADAIPFLGEILTIICAVAFAAHIVLVDWTSKREGVIGLTFTMLVWTTVLSALPLPLFATSDALWNTDLAVAVLTDLQVWPAMLFIALMPTFAGFLMVLHYQKDVEAARAGLVYATEPVWAMVFSLAFMREQLIATKLLGGALIVAGNLVAETRKPKASAGGTSEAAQEIAAAVGTGAASELAVAPIETSPPSSVQDATD